MILAYLYLSADDRSSPHLEPSPERYTTLRFRRIMKIRYILVSALLVFTASCTTSVSLPVANPKPGMAVIKGGNIFIAPISAQYTYIAGIDGVILPSWAGSKDVTPGRHQFAFAASHAAGVKSMSVVTLNLKEGKQYVVEAKNWTEPHATYVIYELPERTKVHESSAPIIATSEYQSGETIKAMLTAQGWKSQ